MIFPGEECLKPKRAKMKKRASQGAIIWIVGAMVLLFLLAAIWNKWGGLGFLLKDSAIG